VPIDRKHLGRRYGPFRFHVGREHVRDFVLAVGGGVPGHVFSTPPAPFHAKGEAGDDVVAPPTFAAAFAIEPFAKACSDPELGINVLRLVHGEQEFEFVEPVRPGDVLDTVGEVTLVKDRGPLDWLEVTTTTVNQHGRVVVKGVWTAIIRN
jgi:acyl dehydratase